MKSLPTLTVLSLAMAFTATAQVTETTTEKKTTINPDGSTASSTTTTTTHFNPAAQTKVVEYFDAYKTNPNGLPPEWVAKMNIQKMPPAWRTSRVAPGTIVTEEFRPYLMEAPPALVQVLPPPPAEVRYYVAGGNVVAVDNTYKVVDSIRVPSVKWEVEVDDDGDEIKLEKKEKDD